MEKQSLYPGANNPPPYSVATAPVVNTSWQLPPGYNSMQSEDLPTSQPPPSYYSMQSGGSTSWPPPPGYYPGTGAPSSMQPTYGSMQPAYGSVHSTTIVLPNTVLAGGCPACRVGTMEDDFTCLGLLCALLCFPFGIIYCLLCRTRRCSNCGAYFD